MEGQPAVAFEVYDLEASNTGGSGIIRRHIVVEGCARLVQVTQRWCPMDATGKS